MGREETMSSANTEIVKAAYAAFLRADIPALLALVDENVEWRAVNGAASYVPTSGLRRSKAQVAEFFEQVAKAFNFTTFEPREFVAERDRVVTLGRYAATTPTGRIESDFVMVFTVRNGKIVWFQEFSDSAQLNAAFAPVAVG
jgi:ketosteroid isomerase-like protein